MQSVQLNKLSWSDGSAIQASDMSAWCNCFVPDLLLHALEDLGFDSPTPIQKLAIPAAIRDRKDILGAAETGSGKTLAFGIPLVSDILRIKERLKDNGESQSGLYSLILCPTRELAMQIKGHLQAICKETDIKVCTIVGGIAKEKQNRLLKKKPNIIVATPGRLLELVEEGEPHVIQIPSVKHLVIDEADRMLEKGHFAELSQILSLMNGNKNNKRQNLIFSATLTMIHETPNRLLYKKNKEKLQQKFKLDSLIDAVEMKKDATIIDLTKKSAVVDTLTETQIMCSIEDKDIYLYYFISANPGLTLVFCNSINCVLRLKTILNLLNCNPLVLHSSMNQKRRFKNLEGFSSKKTSVLLATDIAARGLDIGQIEHVIHYQVPRTAETYVHRSGRTARAQNKGLSLMLIEPKEGPFYKRICKTLKKDKALKHFRVDFNSLKVARERVCLARAIDKLEHPRKKLGAENRWFANIAKAMDVDIDDENVLNDMGSERACALERREVKFLKKRLKTMLTQPFRTKISH